MQRIDPNDPRPQYLKAAASIRAAILSGELKPGQRLPNGDDLAELFGISRVTVSSAVRELRTEGFLRSQPGGGVYVRGQAQQPIPAGETHPLAGAASFLHEAGHMKNLPRAGWLRLGIKQPETVAEHSFRVTIAGIVLAALENADPGRTAALCAMHDLHETRVSDVHSVGRAYVTTAIPEAVTAQQTTDMPAPAADALQQLTEEYEATHTVEARVAHDADKLETLLQAREYAAQGHNTTAWQRTSIEALRTDSAKELARAITAGDPHHWFDAFQESYHELRAAAVAKSRNLPAAAASE